MTPQAGTRSARGVQLLSLVLAICLAFVLVMPLLGCSDPAESEPEPAKERKVELPAPENTDLSTPEAAVRTYLDWISYAYRTGDSQAAFDFMTSWEFVRVDSYVEKNRQESKGIDQRLLEFDINEVSGSESTKTVDTYEEWAYRYFGPDGAYISEELTATYVARYTVVRAEDRDAWLVDEVDAVPRGEVE